MDFLEKLDYLMEKYDLTKATLSQKSDIPYTTIDAWYKKGYEGLKLTTLRKLASYFNTSLDYLMLEDITDPNYGKSSGFQVNYAEMEHIKKYRSLDPFGQETVTYTLDREVKRMEQLREKDKQISELESALSHSPAATRIYTYLHKIAAAGTGFYFDDIPTDTLAAPYLENADFIVGVNGDSMEPTYYDGDLVYVQKCQVIEIGDIGIFIVNGNCVIKEAGENGLLSHNAKYPPIPGTEHIVCIGKVIGKVSE